ncbi:hypothetical protein [Actinoplanes auranticolor]|uniref:hypothetical protein n=1 Tax=Actinoplanes auranticolor TaxID=47988 RepID=UPI0034DAF096
MHCAPLPYGTRCTPTRTPASRSGSTTPPSFTSRHVTTLAPDIREGLLELFDEEDLPTNTYYGDGGRIPEDVMDHLRSCYRAATVRFDWRRDDLWWSTT